MIKKICPICDQEMTGAHFCRNCRSWVKKPLTRNVTYHLNEKKPKAEIRMPEVQQIQQREGNWRIRQPDSEKSANRPARSNSNMGGLITMIAIGVCILLFIGSAIVIYGVSTVEVHSQKEFHDDVDLGNYRETAPEEDIWDDEEIGQACSQSGHFHVLAEVIERELIPPFIAAHDLVIAAEETGSSKRIADEQDTWFDTWRIYTLDEQNYIMLESDTITGQVHGVYGRLEGEQQLLDLVFGFFEILEAQGEVPLSFEEHGITREAARDMLETEEYYWENYKGIDIWLEVIPNGYEFNIFKTLETD